MFPMPAMNSWSSSSGFSRERRRARSSAPNRSSVNARDSGSTPSRSWSAPSRLPSRAAGARIWSRGTSTMRPNLRVSAKRSSRPLSKRNRPRTYASSEAPVARTRSLPVMRSEMTSDSPLSRSRTASLPRRLAPTIRVPRTRASTSSGGSAPVTPGQSATNALIRSPTTRRRRPRTIVSTSGSSGRGRLRDTRHLVPVRADADIDHHRHRELVGGHHLLARGRHDAVLLFARRLEDELVVHLQDDARAQSVTTETIAHADHADLHDVGCGALDRHVDRHALRGPAHRPVGRGDVGDVAAAAHECFDVAALDRALLRLEPVAANARVRLEVVLDEVVRLFARDAQPPREPEVAHAVGDPEVHLLRRATLVARDPIARDTEDERGRPGMDVVVRAERLEESGVVGDVREDAQLDLRVVRRDEDGPRLTGHERAADAPAERRADRDVLEVRRVRRQPARCGDRLVEVRVHAPGLGVDERRERVGVRALELLHLAVIEDLLHDRMRLAELLEDLRVRRVATAHRTTAARELQLREQQVLQLLRRVDLELVSDGVVRLALDPRDLTRELARKRCQVRKVDADPGLFHLDEHVDERHLDLVEQPPQAELVEVTREERR